MGNPLGTLLADMLVNSLQAKIKLVLKNDCNIKKTYRFTVCLSLVVTTTPFRNIKSTNRPARSENKLAGLTSDVKIRGVETVLYRKCRDEKRCTAAVQHGAKKLIHKKALQWWEVSFLCP